MGLPILADINQRIKSIFEQTEIAIPTEPSMEDQIGALAKSLKDLQGGGVAVMSSRVHVLNTIQQLAGDALSSMNPDVSNLVPTDVPPPPDDSRTSFDT